MNFVNHTVFFLRTCIYEYVDSTKEYSCPNCRSIITRVARVSAEGVGPPRSPRHSQVPPCPPGGTADLFHCMYCSYSEIFLDVFPFINLIESTAVQQAPLLRPSAAPSTSTLGPTATPASSAIQTPLRRSTRPARRPNLGRQNYSQNIGCPSYLWFQEKILLLITLTLDQIRVQVVKN